MHALIDAAKEVCDFMADQHWQYCLIGGLAVQQWGEPRTTLDADITLLAEYGDESRFARTLLERFTSRITDAEAFAQEHRVLLLRNERGIDVDVVLGALPFEVEMIRRATPLQFAPGTRLPCCTAEDLFVMKAFASRPRDWSDAKGIVARQSTLDGAYILQHLTELCALKEDSESLEMAKRLLAGES